MNWISYLALTHSPTIASKLMFLVNFMSFVIVLLSYNSDQNSNVHALCVASMLRPKRSKIHIIILMWVKKGLQVKVRTIIKKMILCKYAYIYYLRATIALNWVQQLSYWYAWKISPWKWTGIMSTFGFGRKTQNNVPGP